MRLEAKCLTFKWRQTRLMISILLNLILNIIKQDQKENEKTDFTLIEELKEKLIIRNCVIRGINH